MDSFSNQAFSIGAFSPSGFAIAGGVPPIIVAKPPVNYTGASTAPPYAYGHENPPEPPVQKQNIPRRWQDTEMWRRGY